MIPVAWPAAKILIVDDEPANVRQMERLLAAAGYSNLRGTTDPRDVMTLYGTFHPDLILLDLMMPLDGIAVMQQLRPEIPEEVYLPILVLTADITTAAKRRALEAGAHDFLTKPFDQFEVVLRIANLLRTRRLYLELERHTRALEDTVRERTEQLLQTEKLATMGELLAGVAHELNNPLAILTGHAHLLRETASDPTVVRRAEKIGDAAERCVRIVRNFLALARQRPPERTPVRLKQVVEGAVELLGYELRSESIEVVVDLATDLPVLSADPHQLHQVLVNLIANAHHAMRRQPQPRRITVSTRHDRERERVRLEVADSGPGIAPAIQAKVFDAFFTTKPPGEGTGLGLSLCRGIIEEHGGTITVESETGQGTRFIIELPVLAPLATTSDAAGAETAAPIGPGVVLVVDDELELAEMIAEALRRDGHETAMAKNGAMALELLQQRPYDVVVADTKMPVLDGEELYAEVSRRFPALRDRLIFLTGDVLSREKREFLERTGAPFLMKPCDLGELRRVVRRILASTARARVP